MTNPNHPSSPDNTGTPTPKRSLWDRVRGIQPDKSLDAIMAEEAEDARKKGREALSLPPVRRPTGGGRKDIPPNPTDESRDQRVDTRDTGRQIVAPAQGKNPALEALRTEYKEDPIFHESVELMATLFQLVRLNNPALTACFGLDHANLQAAITAMFGAFSPDFDEVREVRGLAINTPHEQKFLDILGGTILRLTPTSPAAITNHVEEFKRVARRLTEWRDNMADGDLGTKIMMILKEIVGPNEQKKLVVKIKDPSAQAEKARQMLGLARDRQSGSILFPAARIYDAAAIQEQIAANQTKWRNPQGAPTPVIPVAPTHGNPPTTPSPVTPPPPPPAAPMPVPPPAPTPPAPTRAPAPAPAPAPVGPTTPEISLGLLSSKDGNSDTNRYAFGAGRYRVANAINVFMRVPAGATVVLEKAQGCDIRVEPGGNIQITQDNGKNTIH